MQQFSQNSIRNAVKWLTTLLFFSLFGCCRPLLLLLLLLLSLLHLSHCPFCVFSSLIKLSTATMPFCLVHSYRAYCCDCFGYCCCRCCYCRRIIVAYHAQPTWSHPEFVAHAQKRVYLDIAEFVQCVISAC